jgi:hypothetical protein
MLLLGCESQLESYFGPFGDSANLDARYLHGLRRTYHRLGNHFGRTVWNSYVHGLRQMYLRLRNRFRRTR